MLANAHALGLRILGRSHVLDEFHGVALVELLERSVHQVVGIEIQLVTIGAVDTTGPAKEGGWDSCSQFSRYGKEW